MSASIPVEDMQSLICSGHAKLPVSLLLGLIVREPAAAKLSLRELTDHGLSFGFGEKSRTHSIQLLLTAQGIAKLDGSEEALTGLSRPFQQGMVTPPRSRALGDLERNDPANWAWRDSSFHAALLIYARDVDLIQVTATELMSRLTLGWTQVFSFPFEQSADNREPFGFRDGISTTRIDIGDGRTDEPGVALLPPGEVVLGCKNAAGVVEAIPALGENGAYVVIRQLEQDVQAFWEFWRSQSKDEQETVWLAAKALGRWPNGMPVDGSASKPEPSADPTEILAPFQFSADARGLKCPFGAHVRRANPRDGIGDDPAVSLDLVKHHRILRRGRMYGPPAPPEWYPASLRDAKTSPESGAAADMASRGLIFIALCADIARQFEFIQQTWLNNPKFSDLYDEVDVVASGHGIPSDGHRFSIPRVPLRCRVNGVTRWVRVRGGGYFLLPGKRALLRLLA